MGNRHKRKKKTCKSESGSVIIDRSENGSKLSAGMEIRVFKWMLFLFPFLSGLFFEYTAVLAGIVMVVFLLYLVKSNNHIKIAFNRYSILIIVVFLCYLFVLPGAVDWGIGLIGFVKFSTVIVFIIVLMQFDRSQLVGCFKVIPWSGAIMVIVTALTYWVPALAGYFIDAGRLGGFFQYPNTFALFLLIGVVVIAESNLTNVREIAKMMVLIGGILLSGSRISLIILAGVLLYYLVRAPKLRKVMILMGIGVLGLITIVFIFDGGYSSLTRITTIFTDSSTLLGRLLYARDAWLMLMKNPFGLGYMGYYYLQPQFQTGVYTTRFVHQELLQLGLDVGIPALLAFLYVCFSSLLSKRIGLMEKVILTVILIHASFDFDFQYLIILYILMMTLDIGESSIYATGTVVKAATVTLCAVGLVYGYFFVALAIERLGYQERALRMIPFHTEIKIYALSQAQTQDAMEFWSDGILTQNKTVALAYEGKAVVAASQNEYDEMSANMEKMLLNNPYNVAKYQEYLQALETAMNFYNAQGDHESVKKFAQIALAIPDRLNEVRLRTSQLGYQIDDQPNLELTENEKVYLLNLAEVVDKISSNEKSES